MFVFGHLGFGQQLAYPWRQRLPRWPLLLGMLLPDLIDKPLYYSRVSDFISCTRTVGHTGLLCLAFLALGFALRKRALVAIGAGMVTHLALDLFLDVLTGDQAKTTWIAMTWPFRSGHFADVYIASIAEHSRRLLTVETIVGEIAGIALLFFDYRRTRHAVPPQVETS
jgi:hypothetical protein